MATHSSVLAWRIPGTGEPGGLPSMGSQQSQTRLKQLSSSSSSSGLKEHESEIICCSVTQSCPAVCNPVNCSVPGFPVHQLLEFTQTHFHWVSDAIQPSLPLVPFSSCLQSFPASGSFPVSQFFPSGDQSIGVSASASILPMNTQDWFPLGWTRWISLQSKGLSRVFSNTAVQKHQFFGTQLSSQSNSHIHTWLLVKP